jgi:hypothetical protein
MKRVEINTIQRRRVVAETDGGGWLVMDQNGDVSWFADQETVIREVKRIDKAAGVDLALTEIEWRS